MGKKYFHFTIGPVQGFVAQARRTRDFWAGSFILSLLSAIAVKAVAAQKYSKILFPAADQNFIGWLEGNEMGPRPEQGAVPNRFKAEVDVQIFQPQLVIDTVNAAWCALSEIIYKNDVAEYAATETEQIWNRQVSTFWEMSWVIADNKGDSAILDQRKNWRAHLPPDEPGVKCMMMDGLQELSGAISPVMPHGNHLKQFWKKLREQGKKGMKSDLRADEHLCAIGFIKRRFPRYFEEMNCPMPNGWQLKGWQVDSGRPSAPFMAAVRWLEKVLKKAQQSDTVKTKLEDFHDKAFKLTEEYGEWENNIRCIKETNLPQIWKALDGNVFFESALENKNVFENQEQAKEVKTMLKALRRSADMPQVTPFYAVLVMDGDSLGVQMSSLEKQTPITEGLKTFTTGVSRIVYEKNGFLIYAGGDDVLAVLPLEDSIDCALSIRQFYETCFHGKEVKTTLSGSIVYAHIKMPLARVLKNAHKLLDEVAKDACGRDSLAIQVLKPGGVNVQWAMPWEKAWEDSVDNNIPKRLKLSTIADEFMQDDDKTGQFSSRFFYKIRERFDLLNAGDGSTETILDPLTHGVDLMAADYFSSGLCDKIKNKDQRLFHARKVVAPLIDQCLPRYRDATDPSNPRYEEVGIINPDGAMIVRFLVHKGVLP
ncbi:hypothetical protein DSCO28_04980 [Desulfosarcina ovata subsp. sediminis]|uniref:GGDEF domain-containing protein n=1 Tax=Desulfosarcina ovata subsp. sediminis TaxID=885957 RepID=A0A5K7ZD65_9BACT|nr:type III-B CRISPR-associated protein Cas10/Cmr2 [Desulfosarcina ovata]BBO79932.1 hypothetical protein DSCO28_04980 [Desulfosarcina ovata subsp. sediminis]